MQGTFTGKKERLQAGTFYIDVDSLGANQIWMVILYNPMNHRDEKT